MQIAFYCSSLGTSTPISKIDQSRGGERLSLSSGVGCTRENCFHPAACLNTFPAGEEPLCYLHCSHNRYLYTTFPKIWVWPIEETKGRGCWVLAMPLLELKADSMEGNWQLQGQGGVSPGLTGRPASVPTFQGYGPAGRVVH